MKSVSIVVELNNNPLGEEETPDEVEITIAHSMKMIIHPVKQLEASKEELENSTHPVKNTIKSILMLRLQLEEAMIESSVMLVTDREDKGVPVHQSVAEMISI